MEGALLLLGDGRRDFWNRLFTVVFSGEAEARVRDPGACYLFPGGTWGGVSVTSSELGAYLGASPPHIPDSRLQEGFRVSQ